MSSTCQTSTRVLSSISSLLYHYSAVPKPQPKEFIVPLIKKNIWRKRTEEGGGGVEKSQGTAEDSELEREAAAAILRGEEDYIVSHSNYE